jgi:hypothetical protein
MVISQPQCAREFRSAAKSCVEEENNFTIGCLLRDATKFKTAHLPSMGVVCARGRRNRLLRLGANRLADPADRGRACRAQALATRGTVVQVPATDEELKRLRKMAGFVVTNDWLPDFSTGFSAAAESARELFREPWR